MSQQVQQAQQALTKKSSKTTTPATKVAKRKIKITQIKLIGAIEQIIETQY